VRKQMALAGQAGVSSRDAHLPQGHGSMAWVDLPLWLPEAPTGPSHLQPLAAHTLGREVTSIQDTLLWWAPDHSKYALSARDDLGLVYAQSPFSLQDQQ